MTNEAKPIFFCAVGGSGMLPLALIMKARGADVRGSDRSYDQGRTPERFAFAKGQGIKLFAQDGTGITPDLARVVVSTAVEKTVPDYARAEELGIPIAHRADLLAELFNASACGIAVAGTSGKSTVTGLIGWILHEAGQKPTIVNGAVMKNFVTPDVPFAGSVVGDPDVFVAEVDESDGTIAKFMPRIAVLNNIAEDHKSMDELRALFRDFVGKAEKAVLNLDNAEVAALAAQLPDEKKITYGLTAPGARLRGENIAFAHQAVTFDVVDAQTQERVSVALPVPGRHNVSNALAALSASLARGVPLAVAAQALSGFKGIARRLDVIGRSPSGITVIDDFAHNPDKIAASLETLHQSAGRLLILFQMHGYGPLRLLRAGFAEVFAKGLGPNDLLVLPDPLYLGGTVDREVGTKDLAEDIVKQGGTAVHVPLRDLAATHLVAQAQPGDTLVIMGARDDTLTTLARDILARLT